MIQRTVCIVCANPLKDLLVIPNIPLSMRVCQEPEKFVYYPLNLKKCSQCNTVQLGSLIDLDKLYDPTKTSHNADIVGQLWKEHNTSFLDFLDRPKTIFEIGDSSFKLAKEIRSLPTIEDWYIVEPTEIQGEIPDKVRVIKDIFDSNFRSKVRADTVIMSHCFEHLYDPISTLIHIRNEVLDPDGSLYISVPNMEETLSIYLICFEHTFHLTVEMMKFMFHKAGFDLEKIFKFKHHSIFFKLTPSSNSNLTTVLPVFRDYSAAFLEHLNNLKSKVSQINKRLASCPNRAIIFGAHFPAQYLIALGLNTNRISFIIDNSKMKQGKMLYGTNLKVLSPENLQDNDLIICEMNSYNDEIKEGIQALGKKVEFL